MQSNDCACCAAKKHLAHTRMAIAAHDNQIGLKSFGLAKYSFAGPPCFHVVFRLLHLDAVTNKVARQA